MKLYQCRLHSARAGAIAAVLLATSQEFVAAHAGYMAHAASMAALLGGPGACSRALTALAGDERPHGWAPARCSGTWLRCVR